MLTVACGLCAKLRDQWQRGCYHRRSLGGRKRGGGAGVDSVGGVGVGVERGSLVVHFDWSAEFCVERRGRDRLLEAYPRGSVRALQQKHLDGAGNICLRKRMNLNKQATREEGDAQRLGRLVCTHQSPASSESGNSRSGRFYCIKSVEKNQKNHLHLIIGGL